MKKKSLCSLLMVGLWLTGSVVSVQGVDPSHFRSMNLVRLSNTVTLPDVHLPDLGGKDVALRSFRGKVLMLNFWTTW
jgi:hypothetical protein